MACTVSRIDQRILNAFVGEGHYERYLNKMRKVYKSKHDVLLDSLENWSGRFKIHGENAGLHLLLESRKAENAFALRELAYKNGIQLQIIEDYSISQEREQETLAYILLGYGNLSEEDIKKGIERLKETWSI